MVQFMPTPIGIATALLQPPWLYIIIAVVVICLIGVLFTVFKETLQPYLFAFLDCVVTVIRFFVSFFKGLFWCASVVTYPCKERIYSCMDGCDKCLHPYKAKLTRVDVPSFQM
mmetsp:Transcript_38452/g.86693  ORF Transcript_38452/g.86693 Transcript_38452/m.86693 type:complete len:113 (-) Transcript_38452:49-387(-)|eukprot:CAMPEP_0197899882 /NCGR_PEP_ID=MMETSP1439-20131203/47657_1 /TAXON_ID=66791 /ORGANISM="Gonyaulax spinifera, Strain CCMP409" /LENGTH=112 /DNA_ID=CAMNT_0043520721 /DNA_START=26 /DNA_END=364 /DNA_ORIENTATION=+